MLFYQFVDVNIFMKKKSYIKKFYVECQEAWEDHPVDLD